MPEKTYNVCPYCGSTDISIDVDIRVTCHIENNKSCLDSRYKDKDVLQAEINYAGLNDIGGYCNDCEEYFDVEGRYDKGICFMKINGHRRMDRKYING